jgi:diguanylate cyclase (GGDEF)-like protein
MAGSNRAGRAWHAVAIVGVGVFSLHTVVPMGLDDFFNRYLYNALILLAVFACVRRAMKRGRERSAWVAFSVAAVSWAVAELIYDFGYHANPPFPSVADAFYIGFYPACYVGLMLLVRSRVSEFGRALWLDGAMATLASAALGAAVLFEAVLSSTDGSPGVVITNLAYPIGDILLLSAVAGVFVLTGGKAGRTWMLIGAALAATAVADGIFLFQTATSSYSEGTILDALWPASLLLLGAAAWQPSRRTDVSLQGRPLLATPVVCGVIGVGIFTFDHFRALNVLAPILAGATLLAVIVRTVMTFRENNRILSLVREHSVTDALTGLGNRRLLVSELERSLEEGPGAPPLLLALYDLDGFKAYNDTFGHPAGDALLGRLAGALQKVIAGVGSAYRLGGDEFCVIAEVPPLERQAFLDATVDALSEAGDGFVVTSSYGSVLLPEEAGNPSDALRLADHRLYLQKRTRAGRTASCEALVQALYERSPDIREHVESVVRSAIGVGQAMGMHGGELEDLQLAARLHDIGKLAIPDAILHKPAPLDVDEWAFVKEHVVIGERILAAAPYWQGVALIVRATHERWDGDGYVDGLSGAQIPLAARIIAVCDAFSAMTTMRPYRLPVSHDQALDELHRCAGTQFDPEVVDVFRAQQQLERNRSAA